jgi:hypothetical protein
MKPRISTHLLWEYDLEAFDFQKSYKIVIERVLERGDLEEWKEIKRVYGKKKILETIDWSAQLDQRSKNFSRYFLESDLLDVAQK